MTILNEMQAIQDTSYLVALYPLTESIGNTTRESVTGVQVVIPTNITGWVSLPTKPVICNGETQYTSVGGGYCIGRYLINELSNL